MKKIKNKKIIFSFLALLTFGVASVFAVVLQAGYGWNEKIGWINFSGLDYNPATREFSGTANFYDGKWAAGIGFSQGEIDCSKQAGTQLSLTLSETADANGNFPIIGQCFSEQIGWVFAHPDEENYAAVKPNGELTGNFWSDSVGWINLSAEDIGAGNVQKWKMVIDKTDTDGDEVSNDQENFDDTDPNDKNSYKDSDSDAVPDAVEREEFTDPFEKISFLDTDKDGVPDYIERQNGTDAFDKNSFKDTDKDGVPDYVEEKIDNTDPNNKDSKKDSDGDGLPDFVENQGANGGDGDGDGVKDSIQKNVSGAKNPVTGDYATLKATGQCTFITENTFVAEHTLQVQDPTADYPVGLVDFKIACDEPGQSSEVVIYYSQKYDTSNWRYKKFNSQGKIYADISDLVRYGTAEVGGKTITTATFVVKDGDPKTDEDGVANGIIDDPSGPAILVVSSRGSSGKKLASTEFTCKDSRALNFKNYGIHKESLCEYPWEKKEENKNNLIFSGKKCPASQILTQNLRAPKKGYIRNGQYDWYTKGVVKEVKILQAHMNRLGFKSGPVDGIIGPITRGAILRMQKFLGFKGKLVDGFVGPLTRERINNSCK